MPAPIDYSIDKKKEYAGRFIGGAISFLIKKLGVKEEFADSAGEEIGSFLAGIELSKDKADNAEKHWSQALNRTWMRMRKEIDLPNEFWEPLEEILFSDPNTIALFLESYGKEQKNDDDQERDNVGVLSEVDRIIYEIHGESENIDIDSIPESFSKDLVNSLKQEIKNDISLQGFIQNLILAKRITDLEALPLKESTKIPLTMIPACVDLIGREDDITTIRNALTKNNIVSIRAYGGVGKTAVAAKIINDVKGEIERKESPFKHAAWITSKGDLKSCLSNLDVPSVEPAGLINDRFIAACAFLENNPTFLVIDNMDDLPDSKEINILNTISGRTKILITTRVKIDRFKQYPLRPLDHKTAISLFYRHYLNETEVISADNRTEESDVEKIVEAASCNALLVELIAKMACWEYTDRLDKLWAELKENVFGTESEIDIETEHADKYLNVELSEGDLKLQGQIRNLYQMSGLGENKQELMRFFAQFPAETIIFADAFKWAGFKVSDLKYLADRGWIGKSGEGYLIHTVVKGSVELQDEDFDIEKYENLILELSNTDQYLAFYSTAPSKIVERLVVPETVCKLLDKKKHHDKIDAELFYKIAAVYERQGDYFTFIETAFMGVDFLFNYKTGLSLSFVPLLLELITGNDSGKNNYSKALAYYEKARVIIEDIQELESQDTAMTYYKLGFLYALVTRFEESKRFLQNAYDIRVKIFGSDHLETKKALRLLKDVQIKMEENK